MRFAIARSNNMATYKGSHWELLLLLVIFIDLVCNLCRCTLYIQHLIKREWSIAVAVNRSALDAQAISSYSELPGCFKLTILPVLFRITNA